MREKRKRKHTHSETEGERAAHTAGNIGAKTEKVTHRRKPKCQHDKCKPIKWLTVIKQTKRSFMLHSHVSDYEVEF